jgi:hypothetical protein
MLSRMMYRIHSTIHTEASEGGVAARWPLATPRAVSLVRRRLVLNLSQAEASEQLPDRTSWPRRTDAPFRPMLVRRWVLAVKYSARQCWPVGSRHDQRRGETEERAMVKKAGKRKATKKATKQTVGKQKQRAKLRVARGVKDSHDRYAN